ncbi:hypothetical protein ACIPSE_03715 [Streptomyces sp. NPDC090106]|uniref:hypothetical protein n=1 Tax=Streptomyces sp. NPDC090106 TaxID=3365946 RepID=UPI0038021E07
MSALRALGVLSRLEETSPDRTGQRKRWISILIQLARPGGAVPEDGALDPGTLAEVLAFLEVLDGSSADFAVSGGEAQDPSDEPEDDEAFLFPEPDDSEWFVVDVDDEDGEDFEDEEGAEEAPAPDLADGTPGVSEHLRTDWGAAALDQGYTPEEIEHVGTLRKEIHERDLARLRAQAHPPAHPPASLPPMYKEPSLAPGVRWPQQNGPSPAPMSYGSPGFAPYPATAAGDYKVERADKGSKGHEPRPYAPFKDDGWREPRPDRTERRRHARVESQPPYAVLATSLILLVVAAMVSLVLASQAALLPILAVVVAAGGALTYAWTAMLHTREGQSARQRGEPVSWVRALRMCALAVPVLTLVVGSLFLTLVGNVLLPKARAEMVNNYAREALSTAQRLALHR